MISTPPTGRITFSLDWGPALAKPPRCGVTLVSVAWTLPTGYSLVTSPITGNKTFPTIKTTGLVEGATATLICTATLSNGDIVPAAVEATATNLSTKISREECPA